MAGRGEFTVNREADTGKSEKGLSAALKNFGRQQWLVLVLLGLLLVVIAMPASGPSARSDEAFSGDTVQEEKLSSDLEAQLVQLLEQAEGVGRVQVMLYTGREQKSLTSLDGSGDAPIRGVLIVAEGADNPLTVQKIQEAVMALFQVDAHKIKVMKMK